MKGSKFMQKADLGKDNINKLLLSFAIPCVISMLINSVYNIVDQIFIGKGVGTLGNAATNVIFPLVIIFNAVAGLIGNGAAANLSLKLGEGKKEEGGKIVGSATTISSRSKRWSICYNNWTNCIIRYGYFIFKKNENSQIRS